jgi:hypothetical protein
MSSRPAPRSATESLKALAAFHAEHGRLPKTTASEPEEKRLANFLFCGIRPQERRGTLQADLRELAVQIPGALTLRTTDGLLAELVEFLRVHGHQPRHGRNGATGDEVRLREWISNCTAGDPATKTPALRARHEAILDALESVPGYATKLFEERLAVAEQYVKDHGHRPPRNDMSWLSNYLQGIFPLDTHSGPRSRRNELTAARLKAVLAAPGYLEYRWQQQFEDLGRYVEAHGALPAGWDQDPIYSWLAVQRRAYRRGHLPPERETILRTLPGILPALPALAEAA